MNAIGPNQHKFLACFEARGIAFVAETNRFQVSKLDKGSLVIAAVTAKYMSTMPAVMLTIARFRLSVPKTQFLFESQY
jgi:hypothetical protein